MSEFYVRNDQYPVVLKHKESGKEYILSGSTDLVIARMLISMDERINQLENKINIIKAQHEENTRSRQKDKLKKA